MEDSIAAAVQSLMERFRTSCLWHMPRDFVPRTDLQIKLVLEAIARNGDRQAFIEARKLLAWLSQESKKTSSD